MIMFIHIIFITNTNIITFDFLIYIYIKFIYLQNVLLPLKNKFKVST